MQISKDLIIKLQELLFLSFDDWVGRIAVFVSVGADTAVLPPRCFVLAQESLYSPDQRRWIHPSSLIDF